MTTGLPQGDFSIERMCWLAGVSRASYYRHWLDSAPRRAENELRDLIQKMALGNPHYGYRRIAALLRRQGWQVERGKQRCSAVADIGMGAPLGDTWCHGQHRLFAI